MKALTLWQPWASLLVTRQLCEVCDLGRGRYAEMDRHSGPRRMVKRFETRSWPCPPNLIGQRLAFHAAAREPTKGDGIGRYLTTRRPDLTLPDGTPLPGRWLLCDWDAPDDAAPIPLPLGAVVGSGVVTACLPIISDDEVLPPRSDAERAEPWDALFVCPSGNHERRLWRNSDWQRDLDDQLPYGDFTPGRYAWLIEDAAPTSERCPWCWGPGATHPDGWDGLRECRVCCGNGRCDPIPATGHQRIWNWTP